jgi:predicted nucleotidyltransferase
MIFPRIAPMKVENLKKVFRKLNESGCEYLVVGGIAVMAHGYVRTTQDVDLVLNLASPRLTKALHALQSLGYRTRLPVDVLDFADPDKRKSWREEKNMVVFNLYSDELQDFPIDIFPAEPFDFATEYAEAKVHSLDGDLVIRVVSLVRLMIMKRDAGRPQDLLDLDKLAKIQKVGDEQS